MNLKTFAISRSLKYFMGWHWKGWNWKIWCGLVGFMILWPLVYPEKFYLHVSIFLFLHLIGAVSLNLCMRAGLLSFAHAGFMAIGAYTSTLLVMRAGIPFIIAFPLAGIAAGIVSLVFGPIILRLKGVYFVLISFVFGEIIRLVAVNWESLTGGSNGIYDIPPAILGFCFFSVPLDTAVSVYYFSMVIALLICAVCMSLIKSEFGRALYSIHEDVVLAECIGVNSVKYKIIAFFLGASMIGLAGGIFAHYVRYISPIDFTWRFALDFIAYNVVGGIFSLGGPIIGTFVLVPLPEFLRGAVEYQWIIYSGIIICMVLFMPGGLVTLPDEITRMMTRAKRT